MIWYLIMVLLWMTVGHLIGAIIYVLMITWHVLANAFDWDKYHECWKEILDSKYYNCSWMKFSDIAKWSIWALIWPVKIVDMWFTTVPSADRLYHERFDKEEA